MHWNYVLSILFLIRRVKMAVKRRLQPIRP